ncbi:MAG: hypothetical protein LQ342_002083 [Letrouitia transgressa]|nr:MAG: hypothetical protein LQ342_002083 [Letrouitia transgressa]
MASLPFDQVTAQSSPPAIDPEAIYHGPFSSDEIRLRIATGGAGQSGLLKALADAFIDEHVRATGCAPFAVSWLKSDTAFSFNSLAQGAADLSITYHPAAEQIALDQGFVARKVYAWRDHFMLVGPQSNPASLSSSPATSITDLFAQLFRASVHNNSGVRFLSRYDRSATHVKESLIWALLGQAPWADTSTGNLYHRFPSFPFQALEEAARSGEYTLVDRGTWWGVEEWVRERMKIYMEAHDSDRNPILLNPAHALVGTWSKNKDIASAFADWMAMDTGGQKVVARFTVHGQVLYTKAPLDSSA